MERINHTTQYYLAQEKAYEVLLKYSDGSLPIDPFKIIKQIPNIKLMTYTELATELQRKQPLLSIEEIIGSFESERGFLKKKKNKKYILAYNEKDPPYIVNWTLFHELGHYFLEHLLEENDTRGFDSNKIKDTFEKEANCFARHCSSPPPLVKEVIELTNFGDNIDFLFYTMFNMGDGAIKYSTLHFKKYSQYYETQNYRELILKFQDSIYEVSNYILSLYGII